MQENNPNSTASQQQNSAPSGKSVGFPCRNCGHLMRFSPACGKLRCDYCESESDIDSQQVEAPEYLYYPDDDRYDAPDWEDMGSRTFSCPACGADIMTDAEDMTSSCPFCGSHYVAELAPSQKIIQPETLMPFRITQEDAVLRFRNWVKKRWLAPAKFRKTRHTITPSGIYIPFWTFDASLTTSYTGYGGRRRVERYTVRVNGKTQVRTRTVTDWYPIHGNRHLDFDNIPCAASSRIDRKLLQKTGPYSLKVLNVYNPAYLAGFFSERYSIGLRDGFQQVRIQMEARMENHILHSCGYDTYRGMSYRHHYDQVRFKHILLPLWLSSYSYRKKVYQLMINGETGQVAGKAPLSPLKIALLAALGILASTLFILFVMWVASL